MPRTDYDLDEIWGRIFEEGEDIKGSFNLIRAGAYLAGINDTQFKVIAQNDFTKNYVETNQRADMQTDGEDNRKHLKLVCKTEDQADETGSADEDAQALPTTSTTGENVWKGRKEERERVRGIMGKGMRAGKKPKVGGVAGNVQKQLAQMRQMRQMEQMQART